MAIINGDDPNHLVTGMIFQVVVSCVVGHRRFGTKAPVAGDEYRAHCDGRCGGSRHQVGERVDTWLIFASDVMIYPLVNDHIAIAGMTSPCFFQENASSIRVRFPASYVRLPECTHISPPKGTFEDDFPFPTVGYAIYQSHRRDSVETGEIFER